MYKGNTPALEAAAGEIVPMYLAGKITGMAICQKFRVAHPTWQKFLRRHTTAEQRQAAKRLIRERFSPGGRFQKGHVPWTKGRKGIRMSPATEFKPGSLRGQAARNYRSVGTIVVWRDRPPKRFRAHKGAGRLRGRPRQYIKIADEGRRRKDRWIRLAVYFWLDAGGKIPAGHCLVHLDGDAMNCGLANLAVMTRAEKVALQKHNNPEAEIRRRVNTGRAATLRHQRNRNLKAVRGRVVAWWECRACGWSLGPRKNREAAPGQCPKCSGGSFERIERREKPTTEVA